MGILVLSQSSYLYEHDFLKVIVYAACNNGLALANKAELI